MQEVQKRPLKDAVQTEVYTRSHHAEANLDVSLF